MPWPTIRKSRRSVCVSANRPLTVHACTKQAHGEPPPPRGTAVPGVFSLAYFVQNGRLRRSCEFAAPYHP